MDKSPARRSCAVACLLMMGMLSPSSAQDETELSPTLAAIKKSRTVRLGYRESSVPFSFLDQSNRPIGYSIELCEAIVSDIGAAVDEPELKIDYVKVTPETRMKDVAENRIDLECGSTTANAERSKDVAFSPLIFVAGTKLMTARGSSVNGAESLRSKTVVVTSGTTNEAVMRDLDKKLALGLKLITASDHEQSYRTLADGKADAFATDDILLYGLIARHKSQSAFRVTDDYLSYEPYGIMFRRNEPQLAAVVERSFRTLATNHDLIPLYKKWFASRLPTGEKLRIPMSPQLEESFKVLDATQSATN